MISSVANLATDYQFRRYGIFSILAKKIILGIATDYKFRR